MKFGFIGHAADEQLLKMTRASGLLTQILDSREGRVASADPGRVSQMLPIFREVRTVDGRVATGSLRVLPFTAHDLLKNEDAALAILLNEVKALADEGCDIVGLGGATSIIGDRGAAIAAAAPCAITSGNSLTAYAAYATIRRVAELMGVRDRDDPITIVGYPGSISIALARMLLADGHAINLVHRRGPRAHEAMLGYLDPATHDRVDVYSDVTAAHSAGRLIVAASSSGALIDSKRLKPGTIVVDIALPRDVASRPARTDVLVLDGGLVSGVPGTLEVDGHRNGPVRLLNGCLAETIVLALEGRAESWSIGRKLEPTAVRQIGDMAARNGLEPNELASFGRGVTEATIIDLGQRHISDKSSATGPRFRRYINPHLTDLYETTGLNHVFHKGKGTTLTTGDGVEYLDFVAGYGCLNLGHNPVQVVARLQEFLAESLPTFVQYVSMPSRTSLLAERLCHLAPGRMERAFFSNSGAEAVEAALKLSKAATGRNKLVYVHNSYHGKTMGALSVTGRQAHRSSFGRLLDDCVAVPFGDLESLSREITDAAAFIVEPILGEGGVLLPPDGYLAEAQRLCRAAGAVFVVDEVQTGLGRTGKLFASQRWGLEPDVLCVAKSLSGGLVPIGATLSTREIWESAYGSMTRSILHTSTFGGGNFAATAALATLDVLEEPQLLSHVNSVGGMLRAGLRQVADQYSLIGQVRGIGLMNALAFDTDFTGALTAIAGEVMNRLPGDLHELADLLNDETREALIHVGRTMENTLGDLACLQMVRGLAREHRILTFMTANSNRVMRIQPPLILSSTEADKFVNAVGDVASKLSFLSDLAVQKS